jgi:Glycosyltransferases involved in cell wall biogenesis
MKAKVSVIIPVYKVEAFIGECAVSLFGQTLADIEYLFVDDCSPDRSIHILQQVVERYPAREPLVKIIRHPVNRGLAAARNTGLENASAAYVCTVDSDDYIAPDMLETMYDAALKSGADIVSCGYYVVRSSFKESRMESFDGERTRVIQDILEDKTTAHIWNRLVKREIYFHHGVRFPEGYDQCEDRNVCLKLLSVSLSTADVSVPLYYYRQDNPNSIMNNPEKYRHAASSVRNMIDAVAFISLHNIHRISPRKLRLFGSIAKRELLKSADIADLQMWRQTFPESNKCIFSTPGLPVRYKVVGYLVSRNLFLLVEIWIKMKKMKYKLKRTFRT